MLFIGILSVASFFPLASLAADFPADLPIVLASNMFFLGAGKSARETASPPGATDYVLLPGTTDKMLIPGTTDAVLLP